MLGEPPFPTASRSGCCPLGAETEPRLRRGGHVLLLKTPVGKSSGEMGATEGKHRAFWGTSTQLRPCHQPHCRQPASCGGGGRQGRGLALSLHLRGRAVIEQCTPATMPRQVNEMCPSNWPQDTQHVHIKACQTTQESSVITNVSLRIRRLQLAVSSSALCRGCSRYNGRHVQGAVDVNFFLFFGYSNPGRNILLLFPRAK